MRYLVCVLILFLAACGGDTWPGPYPDPMFRHALVGRISDGSAVPVIVGLTLQSTIVRSGGQADKHGDCSGTRLSQRRDAVDSHGNFNVRLEVYRFSGNYCVYLEVLSGDRLVGSKTLDLRFARHTAHTTEVTIPISN
ncbi:MAG: hypothetical protein ACREMA_04940 [Longimicrobiales bacterium]